MQAITQTIEIPANHEITLTLPDDVREKYAEVIIILKDTENIKSENLNKGKMFISNKVKAVSGIINSDKSYSELKNQIIDDKIKRYESFL